MTWKIRRSRMIRRVMALTLFLVVAGLVASWFVAGSLVMPNRHRVGDPPGELDATAFTLTSDSGSSIAGWHTRPNSSRGVIVLLHGIRGSRLSMLDRARILHDAGYSTVLIDLQAHGESSGESITLGYLERHDARAVIEFAKRTYPTEPIGVIGVSLGGAASLLAMPLDVDAIVLESVFPSIHSAIHNRVASKLGPFSSVPASLLLLQLKPRLGFSPTELRPIDHMIDIACPVLIASGTKDLYTTQSETNTMFLAATGTKQLWMVEGAGHEDLLTHSPTEYKQKIIGFFDRHLRDQATK